MVTLIAIRNISFSGCAGVRFLRCWVPMAPGKSSTLMTLMGLVERKSGSISIGGNDISLLPTEMRIRHGISIVPEGRRIFPDLSVKENLTVGGHTASREHLQEGIERVFGYFRRLEERGRSVCRIPVRRRANRCWRWAEH